jgi:hypothetical protein
VPEEGSAEGQEREESIAESIFSHKKLLSLQQNVSNLQKTSRSHHETVMRLERNMSDTISENDLRRAIGLALEEFDSQLTEAFRDANRKSLSMFAKQDDVTDLQGRIEKKVNVTDYNLVLQKLSELRRYVDTMAESVFIGHQESKEEFAKEVNVDKALKLKADLVELTSVRAKLERLEAIVTANDSKQTAGLEELREQVTQSNAASIKANRTAIEQNKAWIARLEDDQVSLTQRMAIAEENVTTLMKDNVSLTQKQVEMAERQDGVIWRACQSLQKMLDSMELKTCELQEELKELHTNVDGFQTQATKKFQHLFDDSDQCKEQLKFLMEATEMLKRRARETNKSNSTQFKDLSDSDGKLFDQLASLERLLKAQERDLKALEKNVVKRLANLAPASARTLEPLPPAEPIPYDPNQHLHGVLSQLEKIANSSPPKLPRSMDDFSSGEDPAFNPALSALANLGMAKAQGAYGLSPRVPLPGMKPAPSGLPMPAAGTAGAVRSAAVKKSARGM